IAKCSFTGEPMDAATREFLTETLGVAPSSMYGSTEVGVILVDYPGFEGYAVRAGALGSAAPGWEVAVVDEAVAPVATGTVGEIAVRRRGAWFAVKDRGWMDADGYVHHAGRRARGIGARCARGRTREVPDHHRRRAGGAAGARRPGCAAARALHRGGDARCDPPLGARHRRPQPVLGDGARGAADDPLRHG